MNLPIYSQFINLMKYHRLDGSIDAWTSGASKEDATMRTAAACAIANDLLVVVGFGIGVVVVAGTNVQCAIDDDMKLRAECAREHRIACRVFFEPLSAAFTHPPTVGGKRRSARVSVVYPQTPS